jgi:hypothetical protein
MPSIDTTDRKYQVTEQFQPDKESTWKYPAERDGWKIAHNALRGEMALMRETLQVLRDRALQQWEIHALKEAANAHLVHIHAHHRYVYWVLQNCVREILVTCHLPCQMTISNTETNYSISQ